MPGQHITSGKSRNVFHNPFDQNNDTILKQVSWVNGKRHIQNLHYRPRHPLSPENAPPPIATPMHTYIQVSTTHIMDVINTKMNFFSLIILFSVRCCSGYHARLVVWKTLVRARPCSVGVCTHTRWTLPWCMWFIYIMININNSIYILRHMLEVSHGT